MTRTTPELAHPFQSFCTTPVGRHLALRMIWRATGPIHGGSSVESVSNLEPSLPAADTLPLGYSSLHKNQSHYRRLWECLLPRQVDHCARKGFRVYFDCRETEIILHRVLKTIHLYLQLTTNNKLFSTLILAHIKHIDLRLLLAQRVKLDPKAVPVRR
ncbi:hypothetical protein AVEN_70250-1 [Araneus ventricosus]|uniref:Uncharacterized protein n=1 Tax=Araneus ventricosus TaxID=182803 RepID=A0A4Y2GBP6_ARAVE|nr:hypothetical protein AVEN_70250-1 [Araneus ventricosus]